MHHLEDYKCYKCKREFAVQVETICPDCNDPKIPARHVMDQGTFYDYFFIAIFVGCFLLFAIYMLSQWLNPD